MQVSSTDQNNVSSEDFGGQGDEFEKAKSYASGSMIEARGRPADTSGSASDNNQADQSQNGNTGLLEAEFHGLQRYVANADYDPAEALTQVRQLVNHIGLNRNYLSGEQRMNLTGQVDGIRDGIFENANYDTLRRAIQNYDIMMSDGINNNNKEEQHDTAISIHRLLDKSKHISEDQRKELKQYMQSVQHRRNNIQNSNNNNGDNEDGSSGGGVGGSILPGLAMLGLVAGISNQP